MLTAASFCFLLPLCYSLLIQCGYNTGGWPMDESANPIDCCSIFKSFSKIYLQSVVGGRYKSLFVQCRYTFL